MTATDIIFTLLLILLLMPVVYYLRERYRKPKATRMLRFYPGNGRKLYELNKTTLEMSEIDHHALEKKGSYYLFKNHEDCLYCTALNEKNAIKHFNKMVPGTLEKL